jgi:predicted DNA-binding ribbon-helix-helix protein
MPEGIVKRSVMIAGHRTSVSVEQPFWTELQSMAARDQISVAAAIARIDGTRGRTNLSSAIRLAVLAHVQHLAGQGRAAGGISGNGAPGPGGGAAGS